MTTKIKDENLPEHIEDQILAEIGTEEESFWTQKVELSETSIEAMETDLKAIPQLIKFHKEVIKMCKKKLKELENEEKSKKA